ncbi:4184_t:CDS:2 [Funneliformis caledonium]|uniref:4184_t:CDS:1 n=1 Tax=Funneliformis caledonium TaxID=1117310 RepID=A0A9N9AX90_9GLOM|nr:4184_t:CDS:2 [Funneliformis caledonium]
MKALLCHKKALIECWVQKTIIAPDVAFTPKLTDRDRKNGPFEDILGICSFGYPENNTKCHYKHGWKSMSVREISILDVNMNDIVD